MSSALRSFLRKSPTLRRLASYIYYKYRYVKAIILGTEATEKEWATRHLRKGSDWNQSSLVAEGSDWVKDYWNSRDHPHRRLLTDTVLKYSSINSVLEVGCNCGPNLYLLAKRLPSAEITGVDINAVAIEKGRELFEAEGIQNVKLMCVKADELGNFKDKSFDVVFTDAVLIYIGPDKILKVVRDLLRLTRRALILVEWHSFDKRPDPNGLGFYYNGKWVRDYVALLRHLAPEAEVKVTKLTKEDWPDPFWGETGAVVECVISKEVGAT